MFPTREIKTALDAEFDRRSWQFRKNAAGGIRLVIAVRWRDRRIETQFRAARVRLGV